MFIVDTALERRQQEGNPIKIGMVGAGYMGQGMAAVIERNMVGMRVVAIANRTVETAERAFADAGLEDSVEVSDQETMDAVVASGGRAVTADPLLLCRSPQIEAIIECTGQVEEGARTVTEAIAGGIWQVLNFYIEDERTDELPDVAPQLIYAALTPFLGPKDAAKAARRAPS